MADATRPPDESARPGWTDELRDRFGAVASALGYDFHATRQMFDAATAFGLPIAVATEWLEADITPWGVHGWLAQGFADGAEAIEYRRWGFTPELAYWARRDGVAEPTLRAYRTLIEVLAQELGTCRFGRHPARTDARSLAASGARLAAGCGHPWR